MMTIKTTKSQQRQSLAALNRLLLFLLTASPALLHVCVVESFQTTNSRTAQVARIVHRRQQPLRTRGSIGRPTTTPVQRTNNYNIDDGNDVISLSASFATPFNTTNAKGMTLPQVDFSNFNIDKIELESFPGYTIIRELQEKHKAYLEKHQIIKKRRVFKRLLEILSVFSGQIVRPLLKSACDHKPPITQIHVPTDEDWDAFWLLQPSKYDNTTNAQRVAKGVAQLGTTFVKLGQMASTRPDILHGPLADALASLQDSIPPFEDKTAKHLIRRDLKKQMKTYPQQEYLKTKDDLNKFMDSLSKEPIGSASIAQVYKGYLPGYGPVAVKVKRPGIQKKTEKDATLFHTTATWAENTLNALWPFFPWNEDNIYKQTSTKPPSLMRTVMLRGHHNENKRKEKAKSKFPLVSTVDEFTARVLEDMDMEREAQNMKAFAELYCIRKGISPYVKVHVPELLENLSTDRIIVMEWLEGTKLTDVCDRCDEDRQENLELIKLAIEMSLSQMIDHGLLHGEPHSGNLLKVRNSQTGKVELGYLDFGLVSYLPQEIRDGIVCAVVQIVFARNMEAVADLCVDLGLLPKSTLEDCVERSRFVNALKAALDEILVWPERTKIRGKPTSVPKVRFGNLLPATSKLIQEEGFDFTIPPYFLNNIRILATLEGMALKLDPSFNILQVVYPYSINRMMKNPNVSKPVQETFINICRSPETKLISPKRVSLLLQDWAFLTGYSKRKVAWDLMTCSGGRRVTPVIMKNWALNRIRNVKQAMSHTKRLIQILYWKVGQFFHSFASALRDGLTVGQTRKVVF